MMASQAPRTTYDAYRGRLEDYFDRTARQNWVDLTSDAKVSGIRATVRAGRDRMRAMLLDWLSYDLKGKRILDAGCGTGALAVAAAQLGAHVTAIDISGGLVEVARDRAPSGLDIDWRVGDMLDPALGQFDHVVAMDSLIHYETGDIVDVLTALGARSPSIAFTFAPRTPLLAAMHATGKLFPKSDRAPAIVPVAEAKLTRLLAQRLPSHGIAASERIVSGFYTSHAMLVARG